MSFQGLGDTSDYSKNFSRVIHPDTLPFFLNVTNIKPGLLEIKSVFNVMTGDFHDQTNGILFFGTKLDSTSHYGQEAKIDTFY